MTTVPPATPSGEWNLAGPPSEPITPPPVLQRLWGAREWQAVWRNGSGGLTFRVEDPAGEWYVKWSPWGCEVDLESEMARLQWARAHTPVPLVLDYGRDDDGSWLVTASLHAENAVAAQWKQQPAIAATAIGEGLRTLHDRVPVQECPFTWSVDERRQRISRRGGQEVPEDSSVAPLEHIPPYDLVVCHGDACAPNTLLNPDGTWCAHVDLGNLGVADRWADLAVAAWSTEWNYGPGWENTVYAAYGIEADEEKISFYRELWAAE